MGLRILVLLNILLVSTVLGAQSLPTSLPTSPSSVESQPSGRGEELGPYTLLRQKEFPNYKVEILQRMTLAKYPRVESMQARIVPKDGTAPTQLAGTWLNPDPRTYGVEWQGGLLDLDGDGLEDLLLQNYSAGVHCCYNYVIYSLGKTLQKLGDLPMKDCGEKILLQDLNQDKKLEIISCNPDFTYLGDQPYAESPFPPAIYTLKNGQYVRADQEFRQIFLDDIQSQREALKKAYRAASVLQIVTDYLVLGDETAAWKEFDAAYKGPDKDKIKQQLQNRIGVKLLAPKTSALQTTEENKLGW